MQQGFFKVRFQVIMVVLNMVILPPLFCQKSTDWPEITQTMKPWTRWWWQGSAVNKEDLKTNLETYQKAGLGGVEVTPIYGVYGYEDQFIDYLSTAWMDMLSYTIHLADSLGMGVDMATGTGWPFGGPWIGADSACKNMVYKSYTIQGGERLMEPVIYEQEPMVRAVGNKLYPQLQQHPESVGPVPLDTLEKGYGRISKDEIKFPVASNENLQILALDQVRFKKQLPLIALMAFSEKGQHLDLTSKVSEEGYLEWEAPEGTWNIYALFQGWHGKMVERAAPGGEGNVLDHFSVQAVDHYLTRFDSAFQDRNISGLRSFFNDSYEVDDASGEANWTPDIFMEFQDRRGYDLRNYLPTLFGRGNEEMHRRVLCDYRETISGLLLENFTHK